MLYEQTIPAGGVLQLTISGRLFLLESTGAAASVDIQLLRNNSPFFRAAGQKRGLRTFVENPFDGLSITGAAGAIVRFFVASEDIQIDTTDGAEVSIPAGVEVTNTALNRVPVDVGGGVINVTATNVGLVSSDVFAGVADVSALATAATQIIAADAVNAEREVIIKNLNANTQTMRIAGATAAAALGHELAPGESITLNTLAAVYAYNPGAGAESLSVVVNSRA